MFPSLWNGVDEQSETDFPNCPKAGNFPSIVFAFNLSAIFSPFPFHRLFYPSPESLYVNYNHQIDARTDKNASIYHVNFNAFKLIPWQQVCIHTSIYDVIKFHM